MIHVLYALKRILERAQRVLQDDGVPWEERYDIIFSDGISMEAYRVDPHFSYYDPDTTYEEDARAFVNALECRVEALEERLERERLGSDDDGWGGPNES